MRRSRHSIGRVIALMGLSVWLALTPTPSLYAAPQALPAAQESPEALDQNDRLVLSYAAKFVCTAALQPGQLFFGLTAPLVKQETDVLIHNPNLFPVRLFKRALLSPLEKFGEVSQGVTPGKWYPVTLAPGYSFRIDCDDIAKLLTGNAAATFIGTYGQGVTVEGYVVIAAGPQPIPNTNAFRVPQIDVTADYVRAAEFLKKDIHYQPWWWWWPWGLPWRLGYAYQRVLPVQPGGNIDCRGLLVESLKQDVERAEELTPDQRAATLAALEAGSKLDPTHIAQPTADSPQALVALIGRCDKIGIATGLLMSVDYVLVSTIAPLTGFPWIPGRWYDLTLVVPQNVEVDLDHTLREWHIRSWIAKGASELEVRRAMVYWFPYWCGWGYWWWWWNAGDCIDISIGEAESLDVEQITPVRVFMPWPPPTQ